MDTLQRAIIIIKDCQDLGQVGVATGFVELMFNQLNKEDRTCLLIAIDTKLNDLKKN